MRCIIMTDIVKDDVLSCHYYDGGIKKEGCSGTCAVFLMFFTASSQILA